MRVLLTGAAGTIGQVLARGLLAAGHEVVALDLLTGPTGWDLPWHTADCADPDAVEAVFEQQGTRGRPIEAVVHLAGYPGEEALGAALRSHGLTTAALLEAMVAHRVDRIVYASSNHAVGGTPHGAHSPTAPLTVTTPARPDTFYGVGKVTAEALLSLYADRFEIDAIACRIGSYLSEPTTPRHLATWLSPGDCVRMVLAALAAPSPGFATLYGISANTRAWWDLEPGRALGYEPRDDSEAYAEQVLATPADPADPERDTREDARVGGPFATPGQHPPRLLRRISHRDVAQDRTIAGVRERVSGPGAASRS